MFNQAVANIIIVGNKEMAVRRGCYRRPYFLGQLGRHTLIGVNFENPVAGTGIDSSIAARSLEFPSAFNKSSAVTSGNALGTIRAPVEHHH
jgi:hypothetical protein